MGFGPGVNVGVEVDVGAAATGEAVGAAEGAGADALAVGVSGGVAAEIGCDVGAGFGSGIGTGAGAGGGLTVSGATAEGVAEGVTGAVQGLRVKMTRSAMHATVAMTPLTTATTCSRFTVASGSGGGMSRVVRLTEETWDEMPSAPGLDEGTAALTGAPRDPGPKASCWAARAWPVQSPDPDIGLPGTPGCGGIAGGDGSRCPCEGAALGATSGACDRPALLGGGAIAGLDDEAGAPGTWMPAASRNAADG